MSPRVYSAIPHDNAKVESKKRNFGIFSMEVSQPYSLRVDLPWNFGVVGVRIKDWSSISESPS